MVPEEESKRFRRDKRGGVRYQKTIRGKGADVKCALPAAGHGGRQVTHDTGTKKHNAATKADTRARWKKACNMAKFGLTRAGAAAAAGGGLITAAAPTAELDCNHS